METSDGIGEKAEPALCITMKLPAITQFLLTVAAGHYIVKLLGNEPPRHTKHDAAAHFFQKASQSPRPPAEDPGSVSRTLFSWRNIRSAPSRHRRRSWGCHQPQTKHIKARRAFLAPCGQDSGPLSKAEESESYRHTQAPLHCCCRRAFCARFPSGCPWQTACGRMPGQRCC